MNFSLAVAAGVAAAVDPEAVKAHIELSELGRRIEEGYVDDILFNRQAFENGSAYVLDNARRLAPAAWPYLPGEKRITSVEALTLNRIAQLICGSGAATINYRGVKVGDVDALVADAVAPAPRDDGRM